MNTGTRRLCPKCIASIYKRHDLAMQIAESMYGRATSSNFLEAVRQAEEITPENELESTLEEQYRVSIGEDGAFSVGYRASCEVCDFSCDYVF